MHVSNFLSLAVTAVPVLANPAILPAPAPPGFPPGNPAGSIISTALATSAIPSAVATAVSSAVAAAPPVPSNVSPTSIPGLNVSPATALENVLAASAILDVVVNLLNSTGSTGVPSVRVRDLGLPPSVLAGLEGSGTVGYTVNTLMVSAEALLAASIA